MFAGLDLTQTEGWPLHVKLASTLHIEEHPSPLIIFLSSQVYVNYIRPLPQARLFIL